MLKAYITGFTQLSTKIAADVLLEDSTGANTACLGVALPTGNNDSIPDILAMINPAVDAYIFANVGAHPDSIQWLIAPIVSQRSFSYPSLAVNTARQASTAQDAFVSASVDVTASLSLTTGQSGTVTLEYADDSGFTTNVVTAQPFTNGNTGTLTIGLALGQKVTASVSGIIPAGKYYRLRTTNNTGSPTFGTPTVQEVLL